MSLTIPNTFFPSTTIVSADMQENFEAVKKYVNGGVILSDVNSGTKWVDARHLMKGTYFGTDNTYEMVSGLYKGPGLSDIPIWHPGAAGKFVAPLTASPEQVPGCGISFYLERAADITIQFNISPRGLCLVTTGFEQFQVGYRLDGVANNYAHMNGAKEIDLTTAGAGADHPGYYRRRYYQGNTLFKSVSAGYHTIDLYSRGEVRVVPLKFLAYSIQAMYIY